MNLMLYVYGNGDFILTVLTSVNFFMQKAVGFFKIAGIISLLIFAVQSTGVLPSRGYDWAKFIRVYLLISIFVMTPYPGTITVKDVITNNNYVFNYENNKLPFGMIVPIAMTSQIMYELINLYQEKFEIDKNLNYTYSGMNFGANFILGLDNADSYDDKFNFNLNQYMQNCGFPLVNKAGAFSELRNSPNIFATLQQYTSLSRFVQQVDNSGNITVMTCSQAIASINAYYEANENKFLQVNAQMMGISESAGYDRFLSAANATANTLLDISQGASAALKQAIGMNMLMSSLKAGAQTTGNGSLALAAYDAEQFQQYKTTSALSGAASARTIPILVGIAFALLFLLYPIMIFLAIAMGSYRAIGVFFQIIVAINLIPLIYEILNYISTYYLQKKLGIIIVGQGYTYQVSTSLYSFTDNMIVAGNYLATATPLIAYSIVTGSSFALTTVFGHINDPAKQSASALGQEYARGNQSIGNTTMDTHSFNNVQGNKLDDQLSMNTGAPIMKDTTPGGVRTNVNGQNYDINYKSDLLATPNFAQLATHSLENSLRHSQDQMSQLSQQWGSESRRVHDLSNSLASGKHSTSAIGVEDSNNLRKAQELATQIGSDVSVSAKLAGTGIGANAGIMSSSRDAVDHNLSEYNKVAAELSKSSNKEIRDAFSQSNTLASSTSHTMQEAVSKSQALSDVQSNQVGINTNLTNHFADYLRSTGHDPRQMLANEQAAMAQKFMDTHVNAQYGIKDSLNNPPSSLSTTPLPQKVNNDGLQQPDITNNDVANHRAKVQAAIDDFKNHQGNVIGNQVIDQGKAFLHTNKDISDGVVNLAKNIIKKE